MLKDKDIREPLFDFLEDRHSKIRIIEEKVWKKEILDNQETKDIANKPPKQLV